MKLTLFPTICIQRKNPVTNSPFYTTLIVQDCEQWGVDYVIQHWLSKVFQPVMSTSLTPSAHLLLCCLLDHIWVFAATPLPSLLLDLCRPSDSQTTGSLPNVKFMYLSILLFVESYYLLDFGSCEIFLEPPVAPPFPQYFFSTSFLQDVSVGPYFSVCCPPTLLSSPGWPSCVW